MKPIILAAVAFFATLLFVYLAGCFANAGFNISMWNVSDRGFIATMGLICAVAASIPVYAISKGLP